jgi:hypothetical protein
LQKQKNFQPPANASGKSTVVEEELEIEVEFYNVLFTKHMNQKQKVWDDGFMEYHIKAKKMVLFQSSTRC